MNHCKAHRGRAKGVRRSWKGFQGVSVPHCAWCCCAAASCCRRSPSAKAFAEGTDSEITVPVDNRQPMASLTKRPSPEAEEVATTPEPAEATNEATSVPLRLRYDTPAGPTISMTSISLRASSSSSTVSLDLESVPRMGQDYRRKVAVVKDGLRYPRIARQEPVRVRLLRMAGSTYYSIDFTRTSEKPVFTTDASDGSVKVDATNPNKLIRTYQVTVSAEGYADVQKTIEAYTQHADGSFVLRVLDENGKVLEARRSMRRPCRRLVFNGSSCGHTGVRTFRLRCILPASFAAWSTEVGRGRP